MGGNKTKRQKKDTTHWGPSNLRDGEFKASREPQGFHKTLLELR